MTQLTQLFFPFNSMSWFFFITLKKTFGMDY